MYQHMRHEMKKEEPTHFSVTIAPSTIAARALASHVSTLTVHMQCAHNSYTAGLHAGRRFNPHIQRWRRALRARAVASTLLHVFAAVPPGLVPHTQNEALRTGQRAATLRSGAGGSCGGGGGGRGTKAAAAVGAAAEAEMAG
jgi:hypothetical protein